MTENRPYPSTQRTWQVLADFTCPPRQTQVVELVLTSLAGLGLTPGRLEQLEMDIRKVLRATQVRVGNGVLDQPVRLRVLVAVKPATSQPASGSIPSSSVVVRPQNRPASSGWGSFLVERMLAPTSSAEDAVSVDAGGDGKLATSAETAPLLPGRVIDLYLYQEGI